MFLFAHKIGLCDLGPIKRNKNLNRMRKLLNNLLKKAHWARGKVPRDIKKALEKNHACYILITCEKPSANGNMQVEMSYEGDACLAAYLIESAQEIIDDDIRL